MDMNKLSAYLKVNKKMLLAIVALLEAILLVCAATFSWIEGSNRGTVSSDASVVTAGAGLSFTDLDGNAISTVLLPSADLQDCSSKDGRNFFFPTTDDLSVTGSTLTSSMKFREGVDADKNEKYIIKEFYMSAYTGSKIYIDNSSSVSGASSDILKALRISLNFNDGTEPVVLCPGIQWTGYTESYQPILSVSTAGVPTQSSAVQASPFADYSYNAENPVAELAGDESKLVTVAVWLEGTDSNCSISSSVLSSSLNINLKLTTGKDYTKQVKFVDYSPSKWVKNKSSDGVSDCYMFAIDMGSSKGSTDYSTGVAYMLKKQSDNITYVGSIPDSVSDVIFARYDPHNSSNSYNVWANTTSVSMRSSDTYYGIGRGVQVDGTNYGYWVDKGHEGVIDVYYTDAYTGVEQSVKFTDNQNWGTPYAYFFNDSGDVGDAWPGTKMTYSHNNVYNRSIYKIDIPSGATKVIFNDGKTEGAAQTVDIVLGSCRGYYPDGKDNDKWKVGTWGEYPSQFLFNDSEGAPNIYFSSAKYGQALAYAKGVNGIFKPTDDFNKSTNYGFNMEYAGTNEHNQRVFHMILPYDATIMFNGQDHSSDSLPAESDGFDIDARAYQKIGYYFYYDDENDKVTYGIWPPGDEWPKV